MTRTTSRLLAVAIAVAACTVASRPSAGALILYDGFADYNAGNIVGQSVGANTIGLDETASWLSNNSVVWDVAPNTLAIGSGATQLKTSPNAVVHRTGSSVAAAKLDLANFVGTLYSSYLTSIDMSTANGNGVAFTVIGEDTQNTAARRFRSLARNSTAAASPVGVNYTNGATAGTGDVNVSNTTFLILSRFTRVGETVDATTPGVATLWALSSSQFDHFKAAGFAGIDAATVGAATNQVTGMATHSFGPTIAEIRALNSSYYLQLGSAISTAADFTFDEVRLGDSLDAVTPVIPEPASLTLVIIAVFGGAHVTRRKNFGMR